MDNSSCFAAFLAVWLAAATAAAGLLDNAWLMGVTAILMSTVATTAAVRTHLAFAASRVQQASRS